MLEQPVPERPASESPAPESPAPEPPAPEQPAQVAAGEVELERYRRIAESVASVAHELSQPLGVVSTGSSLIEEILARGALGSLARADPALAGALEDLAEANALILRNTARARTLVERLKAVTVDQLSVRVERVDLPSRLADVVALYLVGAKPSRLDVELQDRLDGQPGAWVGDPGCLAQILLNLLSNAERYAYPGDTRGRVTLTLTPEGTGFGLVVRDFGVGIPEADLPRIFERLFTNGRDRGGSGLGLAIVRDLVTTSLRGSIAVESVLGQGTTFSISLPQLVHRPGP